MTYYEFHYIFCILSKRLIFLNKNSDAKTVVGLIAGALRRDISCGKLAPDTRLKIEELRSKYGGSNHSMREALTLLSTEGLVEANAQRGFRVSSATEDDLKDIVRLRSEIERLGLDWSMEIADVAWEAQVIAAQYQLVRAIIEVKESVAEGALAWDDADRNFHLALVSGCKSPRLIASHTQLYDQARRFRLAAITENRIDFDKESELHSALIEAITSRQKTRALAQLKTLIDSTL